MKHELPEGEFYSRKDKMEYDKNNEISKKDKEIAELKGLIAECREVIECILVACNPEPVTTKANNLLNKIKHI